MLAPWATSQARNYLFLIKTVFLFLALPTVLKANCFENSKTKQK